MIRAVIRLFIVVAVVLYSFVAISEEGNSTTYRRTIDKPKLDDARFDKGRDEKNFGVLEVETDPVGAAIYVGRSPQEKGWPAGEAPQKHEVPSGHHWVIVEKDGYKSRVAEANVAPGGHTLLQLRLEQELPRQLRTMRGIGHGLLWPGLAVAVTGIVLIEADPKGDIGVAGLITGGTGVLMVITGGILLGLTHRPKVEPTKHSILWSPSNAGRGLSLSYTYKF